LAPTNTGSRVFLILYAIVGIITLALVVRLARETILESLEIGYRKRVQGMRQRRRHARWKRRVSNRWRYAVEWRLRAADKPVWVQNKPSGNIYVQKLHHILNQIIPWEFSAGRWFGHQKFLGQVPHPHGMHLNLEALTGSELEAAAMEAGVPLGTLLPPAYWRRKHEGLDSPHATRVHGHVPPPDHPAARVDLESIPLTHARMGRMLAMLGGFAIALDRSGRANHDPNDLPHGMKSGELTSPHTGFSMPSMGTHRPHTPTGRHLNDPHVTQSPAYKKSLAKQLYEFRTTMEQGEQKAFYARLTVTLMLFTLFWVVSRVHCPNPGIII
jgi:potassium channel subfamily K, other eukaryote